MYRRGTWGWFMDYSRWGRYTWLTCLSGIVVALFVPVVVLTLSPRRSFGQIQVAGSLALCRQSNL